MTTVGLALKKFRGVEIELLLADILKRPKEFLYARPEHKLTNKQFNNLTKLVKRRRRGEPVAYILGYKDFFGLRFKVDRRVLVPRPETEELVELALSHIRSRIKDQGQDLDIEPNSRQNRAFERAVVKLRRAKSGGFNEEVGQSRLQGRALPAHKRRCVSPEGLKILDLGTGSGCIAVSLAKTIGLAESPTSPPAPLPSGRGWPKGRVRLETEKNFWAKIYASDVSAKALAVARSNAKAHKIKINFVHSNILQNLRMSFDVIVANLPYVTASDYQKLKPGLKHEPKIALTDGSDSWLIFKRFFNAVLGHLEKTGLILLEIEPKSRKILAKYCQKSLPNSRIIFTKALAGEYRFAQIILGLTHLPPASRAKPD